MTTSSCPVDVVKIFLCGDPSPVTWAATIYRGCYSTAAQVKGQISANQAQPTSQFGSANPPQPIRVRRRQYKGIVKKMTLSYTNRACPLININIVTAWVLSLFFTRHQPAR